MPKGRLPGLDVVRSLAILLVLIGHGTLLAAPMLSSEQRAQLLYLGGYFGVELFFVLSGFLIVGILLRHLDQQAWLTKRAIVHFWGRRWWRTLPNYLLFLALNAFLFSRWFDQAPPDWRYLLFLQNLAWAHPTAMPEAWSLAVEEWFYLLLPLLMAATLRWVKRPSQAVLLLLLTWILLSSLARFGVAAWGTVEWDAGLRKVVWLRLDAIAWGGVVAWGWHYGPHQCRRWARVAGLVGGGLLLACTVWLMRGVAQSFMPSLQYAGLFTLTGLGAALCLPVALVTSGLGALQPLASWLSRISYSVYLVHFSLALPLMQHPTLAAAIALPWRLAGYVLLSLGVAWGVYRFFEAPLLVVRERLLTRDPSAFLHKMS